MCKTKTWNSNPRNHSVHSLCIFEQYKIKLYICLNPTFFSGTKTDWCTAKTGKLKNKTFDEVDTESTCCCFATCSLSLLACFLKASMVLLQASSGLSRAESRIQTEDERRRIVGISKKQASKSKGFWDLIANRELRGQQLPLPAGKWLCTIWV